VTDDGVFDHVDIEVATVANVFLAASAEVVEVLATAPAYRTIENEAAFVATVAALAAPEDAFQVVVVAALADACSTAGVHDFLYLFEELGRDERLVPPEILFALVADVSQVVAVPKDLLEPRSRHWTRTAL
jgi:hypothetical protein